MIRLGGRTEAGACNEEPGDLPWAMPYRVSRKLERWQGQLEHTPVSSSGKARIQITFQTTAASHASLDSEDCVQATRRIALTRIIPLHTMGLAAFARAASHNP